MEVIKCGTIVNMVLLPTVDAMVTCAAVRFNQASYELTYFTGQEYKTSWCYAEEFVIKNGGVQKIGFK